MRKHSMVAALLGILLGLTVCALASELANIASVALQVEEMKGMDEGGLESNVMDY